MEEERQIGHKLEKLGKQLVVWDRKTWFKREMGMPMVATQASWVGIFTGPRSTGSPGARFTFQRGIWSSSCRCPRPALPAGWPTSSSWPAWTPLKARVSTGWTIRQWGNTTLRQNLRYPSHFHIFYSRIFQKLSTRAFSLLWWGESDIEIISTANKVVKSNCHW